MNHSEQLNGHEGPHAGRIYDSSTLINVSPEGRIVSVLGGALAIGKGISNVDTKPWKGLVWLMAGGYLLYRGISGNCIFNGLGGRRSADRHNNAINIRASLLINNPREEVFYFWRQLSNLPVFMKHLDAVVETDGKRSRWVARGPGGIGTIAWDAEIVKEEPGTFIGWRSLPGSKVSTAGRVTFQDTLDGGTEMELMITYRPPAGYVGSGLAWLLNPAFRNMINKDIQRFKHYMETGEIVE